MKTRVVVAVTALCGSVVVLGQMVGASTRTGPDPTPGDRGSTFVATGGGEPDVICFKIDQLSNWADGEYRAYSVGTTSCNIGTAPLLWHSWDNQHPVISQSMYRYKLDAKGHGRFEQIGQSWLKHGFCALDLNECDECQGTGCSSLGVGCSDPYTSSRNGYQPDAGPKYQVNATTGIFPYPPADPGYSGSTARRLRVHAGDVDPDLNPDARYFLEAHYVHPQDNAAAGVAADNNASYRETSLNDAGVAVSYIGDTVQTVPAILAWSAIDPAVQVKRVIVPGEGSIRLAHRVYDNGDGTWDYEYAIHNLDVDRSIGGFAVPVPDAVVVTDIGFHDVDYHSNDGNGNVDFDGTDWPGVHAGGMVTWATEAMADNENANAIRWDTTYNFRFTANAGPQVGTSTLDFFKPGSPADLSVDVKAPGFDPCAADFDGDQVISFLDLIEVLSNWGDCAGCPQDLNGDGVIGFLDLTQLLSTWGPCAG